jgi:hypothetical protein
MGKPNIYPSRWYCNHYGKNNRLKLHQFKPYCLLQWLCLHCIIGRTFLSKEIAADEAIKAIVQKYWRK